ncbi:MAG: pyridoxamine 5'-phosphate oxidase family protein [Anaerolineae bacterium]|nr:pyridoxamine 5'-phosphate oxidase family protein [Anaerolineae bacterium]
MTLATVGAEGVWATAVFYVNDGFDLYFLTAGHTRHGRNMGTRADIAAAIQEDYRDWDDIKGIQLEGAVVMLAGEERDTAVTLYSQKYPFIAQADAPMQAALAKVNWYRLRPERLYFIDNSKGLGHRDEVDLRG